MELAGLEPATSWVRSTDSPGGFRIGSCRLAGGLWTDQYPAISLDARGLSAITRDSGTFGDKCLNESARNEQGPPALRRASHDAPRHGPGAGQNRVLTPAGSTLRIAQEQSASVSPARTPGAVLCECVSVGEQCEIGFRTGTERDS
jgi:hypothetical protein